MVLLAAAAAPPKRYIFSKGYAQVWNRKTVPFGSWTTTTLFVCVPGPKRFHSFMANGSDDDGNGLWLGVVFVALGQGSDQSDTF